MLVLVGEQVALAEDGGFARLQFVLNSQVVVGDPLHFLSADVRV